MKDKFRIVIAINKPDFEIGYDTNCMLLGSCFTDAIGGKMTGYKYPVMYNPFGVLYNPASIFTNLQLLMSERMFKKEDLYEHNGLWLSYRYDTYFSHPDQETCLHNINVSLSEARLFLQQCKCLFITFGTAWVYVLKETGEVVANCHKVPAKAFERKLLDVENIVASYQVLVETLQQHHPDMKIIFTVSPIRHLKDGAFNNQVSKSILLLCIHKLKQILNNIHYFPAYELFMDELRDYRFYADDMLHPSELGKDYIWNRFCATYLNPSSKQIHIAVDKVKKVLAHRPFRQDSDAFQDFIKSNMEYLVQIQKTWPFLNFTEEMKRLNDMKAL